MSAEDWLQAAKTEEERLLAEIAKTTLYRQLEAVRAVIALYEGAGEASEAPAQQAAVASTRTNGGGSQHSFKMANAFGGGGEAAADSNSRSRPQ